MKYCARNVKWSLFECARNKSIAVSSPLPSLLPSSLSPSFKINKFDDNDNAEHVAGIFNDCERKFKFAWCGSMLKFTPYYVFKIAFAELMHPIIQLHSIEMKIYKNNQKEQPKIDTFKGGSVNRSLTDCIQINRLIVAGIDMRFKNASTCIYILNIHPKMLYMHARCAHKSTHTIDTAQQGPMSVNGHWTHQCVSIKSLSVSFSGEDDAR